MLAAVPLPGPPAALVTSRVARPPRLG